MFYKIIREKAGKTIAIKDFDDEEAAYKNLRTVKVSDGIISTLWAKEDFIRRDEAKELQYPSWHWIAKKLGNGQIVKRDIDPFKSQDLLLEDLQYIGGPNK